VAVDRIVAEFDFDGPTLTTQKRATGLAVGVVVLVDDAVLELDREPASGRLRCRIDSLIVCAENAQVGSDRSTLALSQDAGTHIARSAPAVPHYRPHQLIGGEATPTSLG
jgi:hypothetical protein